MECGSEELACQLFDWLVNNGYVVKQAFAALDTVWKQTGWHIGEFLKEHGEKLVALASFTFAVWRWWIYRERTLHNRLEEYIKDSDVRLGPASAQVIETLLRPGRTASLPQPAFAIELKEILNTHGWRSYFRVSSLERHAEKQLGRALKGIRKRERIVRAASLSLQEQRAQTHLLAGAVAASRARRRPDRSRDDHRALREFQEVLQLPAHHRNATAKECEAFQLLRSGERNLAKLAYEELDDFAADISDMRARCITIARSKRFRAQILQAVANGSGALNAWSLIALETNPDCALNLRKEHGPFVGWDAVEQAEIHYIAAYIANKLRFVEKEPIQLAGAERAYQRVIDDLPRRRFFVSAADRRLSEEAQAGLDRIMRAKAGSYDEIWLMVSD